MAFSYVVFLIKLLILKISTMYLSVLFLFYFICVCSSRMSSTFVFILLAMETLSYFITRVVLKLATLRKKYVVTCSYVYS